MKLSVRAPDHFGDGVMAMPAIRALAERFDVEVHSRGRWALELYAGLDVVAADTAPTGEVGVLFKPSRAAAWRWRSLPRVVGVQRGVSDRVPAGGHRRSEFERIANAMGILVVGPAVYAPRGTAIVDARGRVLLNPWSPTPTVRWPHFRALADRLGDVLFLAGPGEEAAVRELAGPHPVVAHRSLPDLAALLDTAGAVVSNDSGLAHFAVACGARVVVIHGSTDPARTGVGIPVTGGPIWCGPCYRKRCVLGLGCLDRIGVDAVLGVL